MIDMSSLHSHPDYLTSLITFNTNRKWSVFLNVHLKVSNNKCPICECSLDGSVIRESNKGTTTLKPTIDHYRPQTYYPKLRLDHLNYLLMCSDCNGVYKGSKFPLFPITSPPNRNSIATSTNDINNEKPLIANPIYDRPDDLFTIVFRYSTIGKNILELKPKSNNPYLKEKAVETIKMFSLGNCEDVDLNHSNANIQNCRVNLLHHHFNKFHKIVKLLNNEKIINLSTKKQREIFREIKNKKLDKFGFCKSILQSNYLDLT